MVNFDQFSPENTVIFDDFSPKITVVHQKYVPPGFYSRGGSIHTDTVCHSHFGTYMCCVVKNRSTYLVMERVCVNMPDRNSSRWDTYI